MKPGRHDVVYRFLIQGLALEELQRHTADLPESFGLDRRIAAYRGARPIGFYRWDLECLLDELSLVLGDARGYPYRPPTRAKTRYLPQDDPRCMALTELYGRLRQVYDEAYSPGA